MNRPNLLIRIAVGLTLFNSWVLFEETVVDRLGWYRYMPCYRVGSFCEWDLGAILIIAAVVILAFEDSRTRTISMFRRACARIGCRLCKAASG